MGGNPGYEALPVASASRPVVGLPSGPVKRTVSRYKRRLGSEGFLADALWANLSVNANLWMRDWKLRVPFVFLRSNVISLNIYF